MTDFIKVHQEVVYTDFLISFIWLEILIKTLFKVPIKHNDSLIKVLDLVLEQGVLMNAIDDLLFIVGKEVIN